MDWVDCSLHCRASNKFNVARQLVQHFLNNCCLSSHAGYIEEAAANEKRRKYESVVGFYIAHINGFADNSGRRRLQ